MRFALLALLLVSACAQVESERGPSSAPRQTNWQSYILEEVLTGGLDEVFPDTHLLQPWRQSSDVVFERPPQMPHQLNEVPLDCRDQRLWPTHPQQYTKDYHHAVTASYQQHKLPINSSACLRPNPTRRFCIQATWANLIVMSDTFQDNCGHTYRGFWLVKFLDAHESMGTLLSKGRTVYEKPNSQFAGEFEEGNTYPVPANDFILLTRIRKSDVAKIEGQRAQALRSRYKRVGLEYHLKR